MQLILDADDIDVKGNMSAIEESINEKFLSNKIIEHLADDITSGNKENIQKQDNIQIQDRTEDDVIDTNKESSNDVTLTNDLNDEDSKEDLPNIENDKSLEEVSKIISCKNGPESLCDISINANKSENESDSNNSKEYLPDQNDIILKEEEKTLGEIEELSKNNATTLLVSNSSVPVKDSLGEADDEEKVISEGKGECQLMENADNAESEKSKNSEDKHMDINESDTTKLNTEENEEKKLDFDKTNAEEVRPLDQQEETPIDIDKGHNESTEDFKREENVNDVPSIELDDSKKEMECSKTEPNLSINMNENNTAIEIDDEDEKIDSKNNSQNSIQCNQESEEPMEVQDLNEKMEVQKSNENKEVQELNDNMEVQELKESIKVNAFQDSKSIQKDRTATENTTEGTVEPKRICKLSNNLDILSDEEEEAEPPAVEGLKNDIPLATEKQCINIDDDDDILLIDEDSNAKENKKNDDKYHKEDDTKATSENIETISEDTLTNVSTESMQETQILEKLLSNKPTVPSETDMPESKQCEEKEVPDVPCSKTSEITTEKPEETKQTKPPLLPKNFVKTCKKNLADMTRDDLEDFCILKIVESIVDRSNLGEIKSQLKNLTQTMDECKKKCLMLTKQNKDLLVVLKSVQEEQKSGTDVHVTPLKITRSVGMQVVMVVDKNNSRKKPMNGAGSQNSIGNNNANNKSPKTAPNQNAKNVKEKASNNQQIPVPRLVPAVPAAKCNQTATNNIAAKLNVGNTSLPNGLKNSPPVQKIAEKRSRSHAVTVDLTDDEPPAKLSTMQRGNVNQTVRVANTPPNIIPPPQRFGTNVNSPRKVYIPISGAQAQTVRPGQTIMLKTVSPLGPRPRCPPPHIAKLPPNPAQPVRMTRLQPNRHPAPLPDAIKQYQPPNWKALPPAPDLKLSKVENGIVISWRIDGYQEENHEEIASYQLYAYQETTAPPSTTLWKKIGDVKALPLPMACTLTQFMAGYKYYFAVRAVDIRTRFGPFSFPGSILLLNKM